MTAAFNPSDSSKGHEESDTLPLYSPRLVLRNIYPRDLKDFLLYRSDPDVCRYQDWETFDKDEALNFIHDQTDKSLRNTEEWIQIAVALKDSDQLVGDCALKRTDIDGSIAEVGYTIAPLYQGNGYAVEAVTLLIKTLFEDHHVHRIMARVDPRNDASIKLLHRLGFELEGRLRQCFFDEFEQQWVDELIYGLLKSDFQDSL